MNETDIQNGLNAHLVAAALGYPINFPNKHGTSDRPRLEVSFATNDRTGEALDGSGAIQQSPGIMNISVVTDAGIGPSVATRIGDLVLAAFPQGTKIAIAGGVVDILQHPSQRGGFPDGMEGGKYSEWRVPVIVRYTAKKG